MSSDPKKPFDAPPPGTPNLLQKDVELDRRRRVPSFDELRTAAPPSEAVTDPLRPAVPRPPQPIPQATVVPQGTVPARPAPLNIAIPPAAPTAPAAPRPVGDSTVPTRAVMRSPSPAPPPSAVPPGLVPRSSPSGAAMPRSSPSSPGAIPAQPPRSSPSAPGTVPPPPQRVVREEPTDPAQPHLGARPPPPRAPQPLAGTGVLPPHQAPRAPAPAAPQGATGVLPPHAAAPQPRTTAPMPHPPTARAAPPSPTDFAASRPSQAAMPVVTPSAPYQGALPPEGAHVAPRAPSPVRTPQPVPPQQRPSAVMDEPEPKTKPAAPAAVARPPAPTTAPPAPVLPAEMLVTQPGLPGPFGKARGMPQGQAIPQRAPSLTDLPAQQRGTPPAAAPAPATSSRPQFETPSFENPVGNDQVFAEPAALWRRLGAWLTDLLFISVMVLGLLVVATQVIAPKNLTPLQQLVSIALPGAALAVLISFVYTALFAFLWQGRTPGRRMMGIYLVDARGHAPAPLRSLIRALLSLVSFALFLSGFWLALFDRHGQTLHDKLTRTFVVKLQDA
ncbi:MAG: RDD family protein [Myxococcaceae bacterium]